MARPDHLFVSDIDGAMYDTRRGHWLIEPPLRKVFKSHYYKRITNVAELKATLRAGPYTFPGCYPLYFIAHDGQPVSFEGVRKNLRTVMEAMCSKNPDWSWVIVGCEINYEDSDMVCAFTCKRIPSAYGEDEVVEG